MLAIAWSMCGASKPDVRLATNGLLTFLREWRRRGSPLSGDFHSKSTSERLVVCRRATKPLRVATRCPPAATTATTAPAAWAEAVAEPRCSVVDATVRAIEYDRTDEVWQPVVGLVVLHSASHV